MSPDRLLDRLDAWVRRGWIRPLDRAFAQFLNQEQAAAAEVLLAAALVSHQAGRGHICLDLGRLFKRPAEVLGLPPEGERGVRPSGPPAEVLDGFSEGEFMEMLAASPLTAAGPGSTPLVMAGDRLYLRRFWQCEQQVAGHIQRRLGVHLPVPGDLAQRLDRLFDPLRTPEERAKTRVHWQSVAAAIALRSTFCVVSGGPGTGKTTTVVQLLALMQELALENGQRLRIRLAAPTGKAAARLTESLGRAVGRLPATIQTALPCEAATLHRLLGTQINTRRFWHHARNPLHLELLVVDEASMVDLEMMAALLDALPMRSRLILLGDKDQLASVEAGAVLGDICRNADRRRTTSETGDFVAQATGYRLPGCTARGSRLAQHVVALCDSHRFGADSGIGELARAVNAGDPDRVSAVWEQGFADICRLVPHSTADPAITRLLLGGEADGYRGYLERLGAGPLGDESTAQWQRAVLERFGRYRLLTALRRGDWGATGLNARTAAVLHRAGLIPATDGWYPGRPVMVTRNDYPLGLMNGDTGITMATAAAGADGGAGGIVVVFAMPDGTPKQVPTSRLKHVETAYAMTVHKSQGSEFDHAVLVLPDTPSAVLTRELVYTGITRASVRFTLVAPRPGLLAEAVQRRTRRTSGLVDLLGH
jgi:exodeoxyribonuclease V alpha subunit